MTKKVEWKDCPFNVDFFVGDFPEIVENHADFGNQDSFDEFLENNWDDVCLLVEQWWNDLSAERQKELILEEHEKVLDRSSELIRILVEMDKTLS